MGVRPRPVRGRGDAPRGADGAEGRPRARGDAAALGRWVRGSGSGPDGATAGGTGRRADRALGRAAGRQATGRILKMRDPAARPPCRLASDLRGPGPERLVQVPPRPPVEAPPPRPPRPQHLQHRGTASLCAPLSHGLFLATKLTRSERTTTSSPFSQQQKGRVSRTGANSGPALRNTGGEAAGPAEAPGAQQRAAPKGAV